jgi:hypothetical protein
MKMLFGGLVCAALLLAAAPASAQFAKGACPAGTVPSLIRINTIKPGQNALYEKAAKDHLKWYRDHGFMDNDITATPLLETTDHGATWTASSTKMLSIHRNDPGAPTSMHDAAWAAYVAEYRASSDIMTEIPTCLPAK